MVAFREERIKREKRGRDLVRRLRRISSPGDESDKHQLLFGKEVSRLTSPISKGRVDSRALFIVVLGPKLKI